MTKTFTESTFFLTVMGLLLGSIIFFLPQNSQAEEATTCLRGANALAPATGQSRGHVRVSPPSNLPTPTPTSPKVAGVSNNTNGGAQAGNVGNGGNGGNASPGGLVRAGNVVSNANALNIINSTIVRISSR